MEHRVLTCPVSDCDGRPVANCEFCPDHQRLVNHLHLWVAGLPNDFGTTFDADRALLERRAGRGV